LATGVQTINLGRAH